MSTIDLPPSLTGTPVYLSPFVPVGQIVRMDGAIYTHGRISVRGRMRRPHGRTNGPRRWKVRCVPYRPDLDRMLAAQAEASS